jgi:DNA ligase-1
MEFKMFKPMLAPNEKVDLKSLTFPLVASYKFDGIRAIFMNGEMYSRSLKQLPNAQLHVRFDTLKKYSKEHNVILDGELWSKSVPFNVLSGIIRQLDCELPDDLNFYCFDMVTDENFDEQFSCRVNDIDIAKLGLIAHVRQVDQWSVFNAEEVENLFQNALGNGFEGLILRNPTSRYKCGRGTIKENLIFKVKPFETFDAEIIGVIQATEVDPNAEKKINELGRSVTSKKKDDRILIEKASAFVVKYHGLDLKVTLAMSDEEKEEVWKNKNKYLGRMIEYKGMLVGSKDLPRHPVFIRFRDDKE